MHSRRVPGLNPSISQGWNYSLSPGGLWRKPVSITLMGHRVETYPASSWWWLGRSRTVLIAPPVVHRWNKLEICSDISLLLWIQVPAIGEQHGPGQDFNIQQGRCDKQSKIRPCSSHVRVHMYRAASRKSPQNKKNKLKIIEALTKLVCFVYIWDADNRYQASRDSISVMVFTEFIYCTVHFAKFYSCQNTILNRNYVVFKKALTRKKCSQISICLMLQTWTIAVFEIFLITLSKL
jgi:hypothetical protein